MTTHVTTKNILVVEDNLGDVHLIREVFSDLPLVQWHFVQNMTYARDFIHQRAPFHEAPRPDLILLDLHLPICPGFSLIPAVKSDPALRHIKIVVFTSSHSERDRDMCAQLGADEYIVKPNTLPEWTKALAKAIL
jgi:CheY-like chemotaxis protein